jgi:hypothetical protein
MLVVYIAVAVLIGLGYAAYKLFEAFFVAMCEAFTV